MEAELVLDARAAIGESVTWVPQENALYWTDIKAPALHRTSLKDFATRSWKLPSDIGAFALDGGGRALVALRTGLYWLDLATGAVTLREPAPFDPKLIRFNEGACDSAGRFWIGTMTDPLDSSDSDQPGLLYRFNEADGLTAQGEPSLLANGMAWNEDETRFFLSHSFDRRIYSFDYDKHAGRISARREFAQLDGKRGIPDGGAVDVEGCYWCAIHDGGRLHRYSPDGNLELVVKLPVSQPTMCCFAGADMDQLYITSAREKLDAAQLAAEPGAGGLFRLRPGVAGLRRHWRVA